RYGLVTGLYEKESLTNEAIKLATRLATRAPLSVEASKRLIAQAFDLNPEEADRAAGKELKILSSSADHKAALKAFGEKRDPKFSRS
ncbi:MAG: enoyl-CoA hydratase, partial [Gammaproteobacteria bacterium]